MIFRTLGLLNRWELLPKAWRRGYARMPGAPKIDRSSGIVEITSCFKKGQQRFTVAIVWRGGNVFKFRDSIAWMLLMSACYCASLGCERFDLKTSDEKKMEAEWKRNEFVVEGALAGKEYLEEDYWEAIIFFQRLTGIRIDSRLEYDGAAPGLQAEKDLQEVKEWYRKYHEKLCWNHKRGAVELCAALRPTR